MALKPLKPCSAPGCGALVRGARYCQRHEHLTQELARAKEAQRGTSASRGYDYRWQQARQGFLRKHPLCVHCQQQGRVTAATDVDHVVPHRGDMSLFWRRENWQSLCHPCHSIKTATEDGGFGNSGTKRERI